MLNKLSSIVNIVVGGLVFWQQEVVYLKLEYLSYIWKRFEPQAPHQQLVKKDKRSTTMNSFHFPFLTGSRPVH